MEDWSLAHPGVKAVISMNDMMATGALEAVKGKAGFAGIQAYGVDSTLEACLAIQEGRMTTLQDAKELVELNMKSVHALLKDEKTEITDDIGNPVITKENATQYVDMYKKAGMI